MKIEALDQAIRAACPIDGVSIGKAQDKTTWRIDFKPEATESERAAASAILAQIDTVEI